MKQYNQIMFALFVFVVLHFLVLPCEIYANESISSYYLDVEAQSQSPPPENALGILCQIKNKQDGYTTFATVEENKALL
jgi:hypothetical protein